MIDSILPYDLPEPARSHLLHLAAQSDLLLLGELHGTQEVPRLVLGLLDDLAALGYGGLALELPRGQCSSLVEWAAGKGDPPPFFGPAEFHDGRGNAQALSLIRQTLCHSGNWSLLCFDVDSLGEGETWADRDRHMAEGLLEQWQERCTGQKLIAVCGSYHSRLMAPAEPDSGPWPSFGCSVQQSRPDLTVNSVNVVFQRGAFFNGEVRKFDMGAEHFAVAAEVRRPGTFGHTVDLYLPRATSATFLEEQGKGKEE
jgi:hypothetical protein